MPRLHLPGRRGLRDRAGGGNGGRAPGDRLRGWRGAGHRAGRGHRPALLAANRQRARGCPDRFRPERFRPPRHSPACCVVRHAVVPEGLRRLRGDGCPRTGEPRVRCPSRAGLGIVRPNPAVRRQPAHPKGFAMELREYLDIVQRRWPIIAAATLLALVVAAFWALRGPRAYEATTRIIVSVSADTQA